MDVKDIYLFVRHLNLFRGVSSLSGCDVLPFDSVAASIHSLTRDLFVFFTG